MRSEAKAPLQIAICASLMVMAALASPAQAADHVLLDTFGSPGSGAGQLKDPQGIAVDQSTGDVYVADTGNRRVSKFDSDGDFLLSWGIDVVQSGPDNLPDGSEVQQLQVTATAGTFSLGYDTTSFVHYTPSIPHNASAAEVEAVFNSSIPGNSNVPADVRISVSGGPGDGTGSSPYSITFAGGLASSDVAQLIPNGSGLTGGLPGPLAVVTTVSQGVSNFEVCKADVDVCKGGARGSVGQSQFVAPTHIAVDNSGGPSDGAVYVGEIGEGFGRPLLGLVLKFSPTGGFIAASDGSASGELLTLIHR